MFPCCAVLSHFAPRVFQNTSWCSAETLLLFYSRFRTALATANSSCQGKRDRKTEDRTGHEHRAGRTYWEKVLFPKLSDGQGLLEVGDIIMVNDLWWVFLPWIYQTAFWTLADLAALDVVGKTFLQFLNVVLRLLVFNLPPLQFPTSCIIKDND